MITEQTTPAKDVGMTDLLAVPVNRFKAYYERMKKVAGWWENRMAKQREKYTDPAKREKRQKDEREKYWPKRKDRVSEYRKNWAREYRKAGGTRAADRKKQAAIKADPKRLAHYIATRKKWYRKNAESVTKRHQSYCDNITRAYVAARLKLPAKGIPGEVVDLYKAHLTLKREIRKTKV